MLRLVAQVAMLLVLQSVCRGFASKVGGARLSSGSGSGPESGDETSTSAPNRHKSVVGCVSGGLYGIQYPILTAWGDEMDECGAHAGELNQLIAACSGQKGTLYCVDVTSSTAATSTLTRGSGSESGDSGSESFLLSPPPSPPPLLPAHTTSPTATRSVSSISASAATPKISEPLDEQRQNSGSGDAQITTYTTTQTSTATSTPVEYGRIVFAGSDADAATLDDIVRARFAAIPGGYTPLTTDQNGYLSHSRLSFRFGRECSTHGCSSVGSVLGMALDEFRRGEDAQCGVMGTAVVVAENLGPSPSCVSYPTLECVRSNDDVLLYAVSSIEQCEKIAKLLVDLMGYCEPSPRTNTFMCAAVGSGRYLLELSAAASCDSVAEQLAAGMHAAGQPLVPFRCDRGYLAIEPGTECAFAKPYLELAVAHAADVAAGDAFPTSGSTCVCEKHTTAFYMDMREAKATTVANGLSGSTSAATLAAAIEQKLESVLSVLPDSLLVDFVNMSSGAVQVSLRPSYPRTYRRTCRHLEAQLKATVDHSGDPFSVEVDGSTYTTWLHTPDDSALQKKNLILIIFVIFLFMALLTIMWKISMTKEAKKPRLSMYLADTQELGMHVSESDFLQESEARSRDGSLGLSDRYSRFSDIAAQAMWSLGEDSAAVDGVRSARAGTMWTKDEKDLGRMAHLARSESSRSNGFFQRAVAALKNSRMSTESLNSQGSDRPLGRQSTDGFDVDDISDEFDLDTHDIVGEEDVAGDGVVESGSVGIVWSNNQMDLGGTTADAGAATEGDITVQDTLQGNTPEPPSEGSSGTDVDGISDDFDPDNGGSPGADGSPGSGWKLDIGRRASTWSNLDL